MRNKAPRSYRNLRGRGSVRRGGLGLRPKAVGIGAKYRFWHEEALVADTASIDRRPSPSHNPKPIREREE